MPIIGVRKVTPFWRKFALRDGVALGTTVYVFRGIVALWALARQRALETHRGEALQAAGAQLRASSIWQPWRTLPFRRRTEVASMAVLLITAPFLLLWPSVSVTPQVFAATMTATVADAPRALPLPAAQLPRQAGVVGKTTESDKERIQRAKSDFEQERKSAPPGRWVVYSAGAVLQPGDVDQWDDFKVGSPAVVKEGKNYRMWYRGCHFLLAVYTCGVGHATSSDGFLWQKSAAPVMVPADVNERRHLNSLTVVRAGDSYWMWYSVDPDRFADRPYATIYLATSKDALTWTPRGAVLRAISRWTSTLEPTALFDGKLFHLWYSDHPTDDDRALLHVTSANGVQWQTVGSTPIASLKSRPGKLSVFNDGRGGYRALFSYPAREQGKAGIFGSVVSSEGNQWRTADIGQVGRGIVRGREELAMAPSALTEPDGLWVWFTLRPENGAEQISLAFLKEAPQ